VWAIDNLGHRERTPQTLLWTVDTSPPSTSAVLLSPRVTNANTTVVAVRCLSELDPALCVYCWWFGDASADAQCTSPANGTLVLPSLPTLNATAARGAGDANVTLRVRASDAAGNTDPAVAKVSWLYDVTPPSTAVALDATAMEVLWLPQRAAFAVRSGDVVLNASSNEPTLLGYRVVVDQSPPMLLSATSASLVLRGVEDGLHTLAVAAVDAAGNVGASVSLQLFVDSQPPLCEAALLTPALTSGSWLLLRAAVQNEVPGFVRGFRLRSSGVQHSQLAPLPSEVLVVGMDISVTVNVSLEGVPSDAYVVHVTAVDAVGNVQVRPTEVVVTVDHTPPSSFVDAAPARILTTTSLSVGVGGNDSNSAVSLFARLDRGSWHPVTLSGIAVATAAGGGAVRGEVLYSDLTQGVHTVEVYAVVACERLGRQESPLLSSVRV
jgi:hypothetical protein